MDVYTVKKKYKNLLTENKQKKNGKQLQSHANITNEKTV